MFLNYLKIALRNLQRNKVYSLINILGLSLGVACCLLLALYIQDEMSYDTHHARLNDIYRIYTQFQGEDGLQKFRTTSPPIAMAMKEEIPEVESAARALNPPGVELNLIKFEDKLFYEKDGYIADSTIFEILTYEFLAGNPSKALTAANTVVISDKLEGKLFGEESALDKSITISQGPATANFMITGVFRDNPKGHLHANFFTSMMSSGWGEYLRTDPEASKEWAGQNFVPSYLKLQPGADKATVEKKMNEVLVKHGAEAMKALGMKKEIGLELVKDIYLRSDIRQNSRITYLYVIASIAVFILLIACINFMNLSTAKAAQRASEIGIRKVMGAFRSSLVRQLLGEAMVIVTISIAISVGMVQAGLPIFNDLTGKSISFGTENLTYFLVALGVITLMTGLIAGSYPAFYLSSFQPVNVLKGKIGLGHASGWLRRTLVVFQFMIAIILVCGMLTISRQLKFMQDKSLGFDASAKIVIPMRTREAKIQYENLKQELERSGMAEAVSAADYMPGNSVFNDMKYYLAGGNMNNAISHKRVRIDAGYPELMNIPVIAGRSFTTNRAMDSNGKLMVNRLSAKKFGIDPEKFIGQQLFFDWQGQKYTFEVIGVFEDFHQQSLKDEIEPLMFEMPRDSSRYANVVASVPTADFGKSIASIEKAWKKLIIDTPFEYSFLESDLHHQYDDDRKVASIITSFTLIAMFISCLGLYGLSSFMAERRFKEIGVRKVLGASVRQIVGMMSTEFVKLVLIAFVIAAPLAWYAMDKWLSGFAYRTAIDFTIFVMAGVGALMIAVLTVSYESMKAASVNPTESLRSE